MRNYAFDCSVSCSSPCAHFSLLRPRHGTNRQRCCRYRRDRMRTKR